MLLAASYDQSIKLLPECVTLHRTETWSQDFTIAVAAALAVSKDQHALAEAMMNLDDHWISKISNCDWE